jgi:hypothetical protein
MGLEISQIPQEIEAKGEISSFSGALIRLSMSEPHPTAPHLQRCPVIRTSEASFVYWRTYLALAE